MWRLLLALLERLRRKSYRLAGAVGVYRLTGMVTRLTHGKKPDLVDTVFQALGRSFSLTGVAASLRAARKMVVPDKIPYLLQGYPASLSKPAPVWSSAPTFSFSQSSQPVTYPLGVSAGGAVITMSWVSTPMTGATLTNGTSPSITFTSATTQTTSITLRATANGQTADSAGTITVSPVLTSLTFDYFGADGTEGAAVGPTTIAQYWQSAFATKDGTLIDWGTSDHGDGQDNGVREYDPTTKTQTYVKPAQTYGYPNYVLNPLGPKWPYGARHGWPTQYDNHVYFYAKSIDSLVIPSRGQYRRANSDWPLASRTEIIDNGTADGTSNNTGTSQYDGLPLGWGSGSLGVDLVSTSTNSLIRPGPGILDADPEYQRQFVSDYNSHCAYSEMLDCAVRIGGASGGGPNGGREYMYVIALAANFNSSWPQRWYAYRQSLIGATIINGNGTTPYAEAGRDGTVFVGPYVYWVGGWRGASRTETADFFRMDIRPHLLSTSAPVTIEKLTSAPFTSSFPLLRHDPYSNALVLWAAGGIAMFDLRTLTWSPITPAAYSTFFDSGTRMPQGCLGDFINTRSGTAWRRFYWRPGLPVGGEGAWTTNAAAKKTRFHSLKINRPANDISYLALTTENPENTAGSITNIFEAEGGPKHMGLLVVGSDASRDLMLISGDFSGYPSTLASAGYKNEGGTLYQDARQDVWRADIDPSAIASGSIRFKMVSNAYAYYPWRADLGRGYYNTAVKGPAAMDALGSCVDKRGQVWVGPCDNNDYIDNRPELKGQQLSYAPMFKWNQPGLNNTAVTGAGINGVALGNAWTLPSQDRLYKPGSSTTLGVDYDISTSGASATHGWGRTNARGSVYDATNDKIYTVSIGLSGKTFTIRLYGFDVNPTTVAANGNKHAWTTTSVTKNIREYGGPPDNQYTGTVTLGDNQKGGIACAPEMIGRRIYFVATWNYYPTGELATKPLRRGQHPRVILLSIDVDNLTGTGGVEWIPFPESQNWWCRMFDGPFVYESGQIGLPNNSAPCSTPAQQRGLTCVGRKVVLGPDGWAQIGVDPWLQVYDVDKKTWTSWQPPTSHDYPNTLHSLVGMPELGEAWLMGSQALATGDDPYPFVVANNLHLPPANAGRRIVRFKVT